MSFVEIALIINIVASMVTFYFARSSLKKINERQKYEAYDNEKAEFLVLEERKLKNKRVKLELEKEFCMLQRELILNLLNAIDKENVKLDELKDLSKELKSFVLTKDTTNTTIMKLALEALEKHK
jgi:hypothetical protein